MPNHVQGRVHGRGAAALAALAIVSIGVTRPRSARADEPAGAGAPVTVELRASDANATIEKRVGTTSLAALPFSDTSFGSIAHWEHECVAPCDAKLDPKFAYRVAGDGLTPSASFALPREGAADQRVTVRADMGSSTARLGGMALTGVGVASAVVGGTALVLSPVFESQDTGSRAFRTGVLVGGAMLLTAGALEISIGLYLWLTNGTTVHVDRGVLAARHDEPRNGARKAGKTATPAFLLTPAGVVF